MMNGVTKTTLSNLEFEAGLILKEKFDKTADTTDEKIKAKVLCATTGGIRVNIAQIRQPIKFDGVLENTAGLHRVVGYTGGVQFSTKEVDADKVKMALGYADVTPATGKVTLKQGVVPAGTSDTYYNNIYILGKMGDGKWRQITLSKAMNVNGLQETRNDKGETEIAFDLQANYTVDTQDTPPLDIEYV